LGRFRKKQNFWCKKNKIFGVKKQIFWCIKKWLKSKIFGVRNWCTKIKTFGVIKSGLKNFWR